MDIPVVGAAWPEEHDQLRTMAQVLEVAVRFQALPRPPVPRRAQAAAGAGKPSCPRAF